MVRLSDVVAFLGELAPLDYAAKDDNVGLLVGDPTREVRRVMTALTLSPDVAQEAVTAAADLVVAHHPFPYRPLLRVTTIDPVGRILWQLAAAQVAVYSAHTAWDSARGGINELWGEVLGLEDLCPLRDPRPDGAGTGRWGRLGQPQRLSQLVDRVKRFLRLERVAVVGNPERFVRTVGIACGSGAELLPAAIDAGCEVLLSGEMSYHRCLQAKAAGLDLILVGHFASERFGMERLAELVAARFPNLEVWASRVESDPLTWL